MKEAVTERLEEYRCRLSASPHVRSVDKLMHQCGEEFDEAQQLYLHIYAPVLTEFTGWVLHKALQSGKRRLYFLARDAYPMYLTACRICEERSYGLECRYLSVSRYAMRLPEYRLIGEKCLERICIGGIDVTFYKIMRRAGLTTEESDEIAQLAGYDSGQALSYREVMKLKEKLRAIPQFLEYTYRHSQAAYPDAIGYLEQEGMLDTVPYALVDSGWTGTLQQSIQNLLRTVRRDIVLEGYYFGLYEIPRGEKKKQYHGFYFEPRSGLKRKIYFSNCLFETVYSGKEGMTVGYVQENGRFYPKHQRSSNLNAAFLEKNEKVLCEYVQTYLECTTDTEDKQADSGADRAKTAVNRKPGGARPGVRHKADCKISGAKLCEKLLTAAMGKPRKWEAEAYGNCHFCDDVIDDRGQCVAARLEKEQIAGQKVIYRVPAMLGLRKGSVSDSAWMEGSIVRSDEKDKEAALRSVAMYKRLVYIKKALKR